MQESIYDPGYAVFGGGSSASVIHPLVLGLVVLIAILVFTLPRRYVILPLILGTLLIPAGQNLYLGGFHLYMYRLLVLIGWMRVGISSFSSPGKLLPGGFNILDKLFLVWAIYRTIAAVLLYGQMAAVIGQVAFLWDSLGGYFLFRALIESEEDVLRIMRVLAVVAVIAAAGMIYEHVRGENLFAFLGGVRPVPEIREGHIRAQAFFGHALLAGAFGATIFFQMGWLWKRGKTWLIPLIGMASCLVMTFAASTSTPIMALMGGFFALCLWPIREHMRVLRWGLVISIIGLHLVMKAPVWFVLGHIDLSGGSTGNHRAMLIDNFIRHFGDWWLIGTHDYVNWGYYMYDQCNQYILEGENGGLVAFVCFIAIFYVCYRWIGNRRKAVKGDKGKEWLIWMIGAAFFSQTMAFVGVDYFDQSKALWYLLLVIVTVVAYLPAKETALTQLTPVEEPAPGLRKRWGSPEPNHNISLASQSESGGKLRSAIPSRSTTDRNGSEKSLLPIRSPRK